MFQRTCLLALTFSALSLSLAQGELSLDDLTDVIGAEDRRSGGLLPFPAEGSQGVVSQTDAGFLVSYAHLEVFGLGLESLRFSVVENDEGLLAIELIDYALSDQTAGFLDAVGWQGDLPRFVGNWDVAAQTYAAFSLTAPLALQPDVSTRISGDLSLSGVADEGFIQLTANNLRASEFDREIFSIARLEATVSGAAEGGVDPYAIGIWLNENLGQLTDSNPQMLLALIPAYTQTLLGADMGVELFADDLSFHSPLATATLNRAHMQLQKIGQETRGRQEIAYTLTLEDARVEDFGPDKSTLAFDNLNFDQSISVSDVLAALGGGTRLSVLASRIESAETAAAFATAVGKFVDQLAPQILSSSRIKNLTITGETQGVTASLDQIGHELVIDLKESVRLSVSAQNAAADVKTRGEHLALSLAEISADYGYPLWETFPTDVADAIAQGLNLVGAAQDSLGGRWDRDVLPALSVIPALSGLAVNSTARLNDAYFMRTTGDEGQYGLIETAGWKVGAFPSDTGTRLDYDFDLTDLIFAAVVDGDAPAMTPAEIRQAKDAQSLEALVHLSAAQNFDLDLAPVGPYLEKMGDLAGQAMALEAPRFDAYRPLIEEALIATLGLFNGMSYDLQIEDLQVPEVAGERQWEGSTGVSADTIRANLFFDRNRGFGYSGEAQALQVAFPPNRPGNSFSLNQAGFHMGGDPFPDGYGRDYVRFYMDMMQATFAQEAYVGPTWGDYARMLAFDYASRNEVYLDDLWVDLIRDHLELTLDQFRLTSPGKIEKDPLALSQDLTLDWQGLATSASAPEVENFFKALIPQEAKIALTSRLGLHPGALKILDQVPLVEGRPSLEQKREQARALNQLFAEIGLSDFNLTSAQAQLTGDGQFKPTSKLDLKGIGERWDSALLGLDISPNLKAKFRLSGLAHLQASAAVLIDAQDLGPLTPLQALAEELQPLFETLDQMGKLSNKALTYTVTMPGWPDVLVNGKPFPN